MLDLEGEEDLFVVTTDETRKLNESQSVPGGWPVSSDVIAHEGLEASLSRDREATLRLVEEAPLRLVASALIEARGRTATVGDIKSALTRDIIKDEDWNKWWNVVRFGIRESRHFSYSPREPIRLRIRNPAEVDSDSLDDLRTVARRVQATSKKLPENSVPMPSIAGLGGWILWVQADEDEPMPRSIPPADFVKFLRKLPESVTKTAISRLTSGITQRLLESKQRPAGKSVEMWQESLVSALTRWSELSDLSTTSVEDTVALTTRVLEKLGPNEFKDIVIWLAEYTSESTENIETVSSALLNAYAESQEGTERLLAAMDGLLEAPIKIALWRRLLRLGLAQPDRVPMGRWLRVLSQEDKSELFTGLLADAHDESYITEIGSLLGAEWRLANVDQRHRLFDAVALGWVLHRQSLPDARTAMIEALAEVDDNHEFEGSFMSEWRELVLSASEYEVRRVQEDRDSHVCDLERRLNETKGELNQARRQVSFLEAENRTKRSNAELEISRDAITVLGIALQSLASSSEPKTREIADLEASITLALSTLGAKPTGEIGEVAPFDPVLHDASNPLPVIGTPVTVAAPGVRYSRRGDSPVNLVRIKVQVED